MLAYACQILSKNMGAIASENPNFNLRETIAWLKQHGSGYFLRDETSPFDCQYIEDTVFHELYAFEADDVDEMFRKVLKL